MFHEKTLRNSKKHSQLPPVLVESVLNEETQSLETQLKDMWSNVLGIPVEELTDSSHFLDLGGDSLAFIDLFNYIKRTFSANFNLEDIIKHNEFGSMHQYINSRMVESGAI